MNKIRVLMIGPSLNDKGGIASVVNQYYNVGLQQEIVLDYLSTTKKIFFPIQAIYFMISLFKFLIIIHKYNIVHIHMASGGSFFRKSLIVHISKISKKKIIIHLHGAQFNTFYLNSNILIKKLISKTFGKAHCVLALSEEWKSFLSCFCKEEKIKVFYNSVIVPKSQKKNYELRTLLFLGRIGKRKGAFDLLEIIPKVIKKYPDCYFYFCGDGEVELLQKETIRNNIENNVIIKNWINEKEKDCILRQSTIFVLPSYNEGMPMALLEAMSYSCATIATDVGGIPQVISNNVNGLINKAGDKDALLKNILMLLDSPKKSALLGEQAYSTIQTKFNLKVNIKLLIDIYHKVLT